MTEKYVKRKFYGHFSHSPRTRDKSEKVRYVSLDYIEDGNNEQDTVICDFSHKLRCLYNDYGT